MLLLDLFETPIANIYTHGDFSEPGSLRQDDLSLSTQKRQDKIKRVLQNAPIEIDLHILNIAVPVSNAKGEFDIKWHLQNKERIGYLKPEQVAEYWMPISPRPDALNLLLLQNEGEDRMPMTPWIIAHRLSHAFDYAEPLTVDKLFNKNFLSTLQDIQDGYRNVGLAAPKFSRLASIYGTTRACREGLIKEGRMGEWYHDCFAQMCVTGDIRFNKAPTSLDYPEAFDESFQYLRQKLLNGFKKILDRSVGKIMAF